MKIGLLTLPFHRNYGGILQAWALKTVLERIGHEVVLVVEPPHYRFQGKILQRLQAFFHFFSKSTIQHQNFKSFESFYFKKRLIQNHNSFINIQDLKAIVVGSDQVWRSWNKEWNTPFYFLDFARDWAIKRISYAASFGYDYFHVKDCERKICVELAKKFNRISVREFDGIDICEKEFGITPCVTLDPTMLLDKEDYIELCKTPINHIGGLVKFILDADKTKNEIVNLLSEKFKCVRAANVKLQSNILFCKYNQYAPVETWIATMADADYIITDSFHGTVFSINFEIPFVVMGNPLRGQSRLKSVLKMFGLEDRLISSAIELEEVMRHTIDWENVNAIKREMRNSSFDFLNDNLYD